MFLIVYTTYPDEKSAESLCNELLKQHLIACYNLIPIKSAYWWEGAIQNDNELVGILKTTQNNWQKICDFLESNHPYAVPCIVQWQVSANPKYEQWIIDNTSTI